MITYLQNNKEVKFYGTGINFYYSNIKEFKYKFINIYSILPTILFIIYIIFTAKQFKIII